MKSQILNLKSQILAFAIVAVSAPLAFAEFPQPRLDRVKPLGASAGSEIEFEINGQEADKADQLLFGHPGLSATPVEKKPRYWKLKIADNVPAGTYDVWSVGPQGISSPRLISVSKGLKDLNEKEPNNSPETANPIEINSATNGESDGSDHFKFTAKKGQRLSIDLLAARLDSDLDGNMSVLASDGRILASCADYFGLDPFLDFTAPADGEYTILVHDLSYRGGRPYRLVVSDKPHIENAFPRAIEFGKPTEITMFGRNLGPGSTPSKWQADGVAMEERKITLAPAEPGELAPAFDFLAHPTDYSTSPTAATCTVRGFEYRPADGELLLRTTGFLRATTPPTNEVEPNDTAEAPQALTLPALVNARFDQPRDVDMYTFEVPAGQSGPYQFQIYCERIAGRADPYLVVLDDQSKEMAEHDDFGHRNKAFDGLVRDPMGVVGLTEKKKYRVVVADRYGRGSGRHQYVLSIRKEEPDFHVAAIHSANPNVAGTSIRRGGSAWVDLIIHYEGNVKPNVVVTAEDLPPGLHAAPWHVAGETRASFVLWADPGCAEWAGPIKLVATAEIAGKQVRRLVTPYTRVFGQGTNSSRPMQQMMVAIKNDAPYLLTCEPATLELAAGAKGEIKVKLDRRFADFTGKVQLATQFAPGRIKVGTGEVPAGKNDATLSVEVQAGTAPGDYTFDLLGDAQVAYNPDPKATSKPNIRVADSSLPVTVRVTAPPVPAKK